MGVSRLAHPLVIPTRFLDRVGFFCLFGGCCGLWVRLLSAVPVADREGGDGAHRVGSGKGRVPRFAIKQSTTPHATIRALDGLMSKAIRHLEPLGAEVSRPCRLASPKTDHPARPPGRSAARDAAWEASARGRGRVRP